ncbi:MAG: fimbrillin family protein [Bacteroides sp.]|nr:fimbrillin family protein [Bacteroides sp.]
MIQTKLYPSRLCLLMAAIAGLCTSCSDITDSGGNTSLPDGRYPMTFSAAVDGLTVSRAATGKDTWTVNDEIAISVDGGTSNEKYKITSISSTDGTGTLSPSTTGECCYWQQNKGQQILAWYPAVGAPDPSANPSTSYVDISNQQNGFSDFDYLTANVTTNFTTDAVSLSFKHQMAKVICTLAAGEGINDTDLQSAEVKISGYTQVTFTKGTLSGIGDNGWITPGSDKEALVVPQDMAGKQFIKVTVGTGNTARDYYYTPGENNAALESGKAYTYAITVTKTGLEVTVTGNGASWGSESSLGDSSPSEIAYQVTIPQVEGMPIFTKTNLSSKAKDDIYTVSDASFSISYTVPTDDKGMTGFTPPAACAT